MFELFTDAAEAVVLHGIDEAQGVAAKEIEPVHLLLGIMDFTDGVGAAVLTGEGVNRQSVINKLGLPDTTTKKPGRIHNRLKGGAMQFSSGSQQALQAAEQQALQLQSPTITAEHLLLGLLQGTEMQELVSTLGSSADAISHSVKEKLDGAG
ncbi:Clp protease N-terminal domain-containing protein [Arthrobacter sp. GMC3]|uniref:Clp protease N-terminal domain-containing protein n=1 Tax=Arthrobacter sp. GMC3 TaxID=2058894 RepID=UPI0015E2EC83|nr:Clp protease N-terminal domain-containing protein [Arthrobacter sp. GMC3]